MSPVGPSEVTIRLARGDAQMTIIASAWQPGWTSPAKFEQAYLCSQSSPAMVA
jgi:hypothetical protein